MARRRYVDNAPAATLSAPLTSSATTVSVSTVTGFPPVPFSATIERGTTSAEVILVTGVTGTTLTISRNDNGLGAFSHIAGAPLEHTVVAKDVDEANDHINQSVNVHGVSGNVVGTAGTQTLTGKTLASGTLSGTTGLNGTLAGPGATATLQNATITGTSTLTSVVVPTGGSLALQGTASATISGSLSVSGSTTLSGTVVTTLTASGLLTANGGLQHRVFADATARDAAITSPTVGLEVHLTTPGCNSIYTTAGWHNYGDDTGWVSLTSALASPFVAAAGVDAPQVRTKNGLVSFRGAVARTGGYAAQTSYTLIASGGVPAAHRPPVPSGGIGQITRSLGSAGGSVILGSVFNDGRVTVAVGTNAPTWIDLSGLNGYTTD